MESTLKRCTRCCSEKPLFEFSVHTSSKDGKQSQCKPCFAERARLKRVGKPCIVCATPKEVGVPKGARLCLKCAAICTGCGERPRAKQHRHCSVCMAKADKIRNAKPERKYRERITRVKSKYKVSRKDAELLVEKKSCDACGNSKLKLHVDHCHTSGAVRGVLCFTCNVALGNLKDSLERLEMLIKYLKAHHAKTKT